MNGSPASGVLMNVRGAAPRGDRGSGSVLAIALVAGIAALTMLLLPLSLGLVVRQSVVGAADAAALAAADTAVGRVAGYPCAAASRVAAANGASLASCTVDGLVVTVTASRLFAGIAVSSSATAGPAGSAAD